MTTEEAAIQQRLRTNKYYKKKYKLDIADIHELLAGQGYACALCRETGWCGHAPQVDHDHATGRVRGILCRRCNAALGMGKDDPAILRTRAEYLER